MIEASFNPEKTNQASVSGAAQYDSGQRLFMRGLPTPEELAERDDFLSGDVVSVQVQYAYKGDSQSESRVATYDEENDVWVASVPNKYLLKHYPVDFYVYVGYGATEETARNKTMYIGSFTPSSRPAPYGEVTPDQLNAWDALVAEVNLALAETNQAVSTARGAAVQAIEAANYAQLATGTLNETIKTVNEKADNAQEAADRLNLMNPIQTINGFGPDENGDLSKGFSRIYAATFTARSWVTGTPNYQRVSVPGLLATDRPIVDLDMSNALSSMAADMQEAYAMIGRIVAEDGKIVAYAYDDVPTIDLPVSIMAVR